MESHCRRKCTRGMEFKVICGAIIFASLSSFYCPLEKLSKISFFSAHFTPYLPKLLTIIVLLKTKGPSKKILFSLDRDGRF